MTNRKQPKILVVGPWKAGFIGGVAAFARGQISNPVLTEGFELSILDSVSERAPDSGQFRRLFNTAALLPRLAWRVLRARPALVHLHCSAGPSFWQKVLLTSLAGALGSATLLHIHVSYFIDFYNASRLKLLIRLALRSAGGVAVISENLAAFLRENCGCDPVVVPNCPDPMFFDTHSDPATGSDMVFLGGITERKGVPVLIEALASLRRRGHNNRLVLAGITHNASTRADLENQVRENGLEPLELIENAGPERIRELLAGAALFVLPSLTEGMPVSLLEAMAAGVPSVVTRVGGIPEAVTDGEHGLLVEPGDAEGLAAALETLLKSPELRARMGRAARQKALEQFHPDSSGRALAALYNRLLERR